MYIIKELMKIQIEIYWTNFIYSNYFLLYFELITTYVFSWKFFTIAPIKICDNIFSYFKWFWERIPYFRTKCDDGFRIILDSLNHDVWSYPRICFFFFSIEANKRFEYFICLTSHSFNGFPNRFFRLSFVITFIMI